MLPDPNRKPWQRASSIYLIVGERGLLDVQIQQVPISKFGTVEAFWRDQML